jgi:putative membrane protein insertion efficiency factor
MSALRKRLKRPETYLIPVLALWALAALDSFRAPGKQVTAQVYLGAVHGYQRYGRRWLQPYIHCRYRPTCSEYSIQAVRKWGIRRGLLLTTKRLLSCTSAVPDGTPDPAP